MGSSQPPLGELELEVLKVIWDLQPATVKQIADVLSQRSGHARTTVLTVMQRLHAKGFLRRTKKERVWRYSSTHDRQQTLSRLVGRFVDTVLDSSPAPFVAYLAQSKGLTLEQVDALRSIMRNFEKTSGEDQP